MRQHQPHLPIALRDALSVTLSLPKGLSKGGILNLSKDGGAVPEGEVE